MVNNCGNCRFFELADKSTGNGACREGPPQLIVNSWIVTPVLLKPGQETRAGTMRHEAESLSGQQPPTHRDLWCGKWDERPVKKEAN